MARLAGIDLPNNKKVHIALTYIYGIGHVSSLNILKTLNIESNIKVRDLSSNDLNLIRKTIDANYIVEGDLRRKKSLNIKRLVDLGAYRGMRHRKSLPVRGQRTKTNARTMKGPRKTIANKKKAPK